MFYLKRCLGYQKHYRIVNYYAVVFLLPPPSYCYTVIPCFFAEFSVTPEKTKFAQGYGPSSTFGTKIWVSGPASYHNPTVNFSPRRSAGVAILTIRRLFQGEYA